MTSDGRQAASPSFLRLTVSVRERHSGESVVEGGDADAGVVEPPACLDLRLYLSPVGISTP